MIENNRKETLNKICIYRLFTNDEKSYVGASKNLYYRINVHKNDAIHKPTLKISKAISTIGWDNFNLEILKEVENPVFLKEFETFYINKYKSNQEEFGFNGNRGGTGSSIGMIKRPYRKNKTWRNPRAILCITTGIEYKSINIASKLNNIPQSSISACCIGKKYKSGGKLPDGTKLTWKYI